MIVEPLMKLLEKHEGRHKKPYVDSVGKLTIGVGRNLDDNGLNDDAIDYLLLQDINQTVTELSQQYIWVFLLDDVRLMAVIDMYFNLGGPRFATFKRFLAALKKLDFDKASVEMLDSKWSEQVGDRARELAHMIRYGKMRDEA